MAVVGKVTWLVLATIMINIAATVIAAGVLDAEGNQVFNPSAQSNYPFDYTEEYSTQLTTELEETIKPAGSIEDAGDQIYRVLDVMSLGFIYKFIGVVDKYMYTTVNILDNIVGQYLADDVRAILFGNSNNDDLIPNKFGALKLIISILYTFAGIQLFTGKNVVDD